MEESAEIDERLFRAYIGPNEAHRSFRLALTTAKVTAYAAGQRQAAPILAVLTEADQDRRESGPDNWAIGLTGRSTTNSAQLAVLLRDNELTLLEREQQSIVSSIFGLMICEVNRVFETFLVNLFSEIALAEPAILCSNRQLTHEKILRAGSYEAVVELIVADRISDLTRGGLKGFASTFASMGLPMLADSASPDIHNAWERLCEMSARRNAIEHAKGIVTAEYFKVAPNSQHSVGEKLSFTAAELGDACGAVETIADQMNQRSLLKFPR